MFSPILRMQSVQRHEFSFLVLHWRIIKPITMGCLQLSDKHLKNTQLNDYTLIRLFSAMHVNNPIKQKNRSVFKEKRLRISYLPSCFQIETSLGEVKPNYVLRKTGLQLFTQMGDKFKGKTITKCVRKVLDHYVLPEQHLSSAW